MLCRWWVKNIRHIIPFIKSFKRKWFCNPNIITNNPFISRSFDVSFIIMMIHSEPFVKTARLIFLFVETALCFHGHVMCSFVQSFTSSVFLLQVGTYFNFIMGMVASSVVLTVIVLNYHHRYKDSQRNDNNRIERWFTHWHPFMISYTGWKSIFVYISRLCCS